MQNQLKTEMVAIDDLHHDASNVRQHSARNIQSIAASLQRFGQQKPIVVDSNNVVRAGNGTLEAARSLGWNEINIVKTNLKEAEASAFAIADNRTAELANWDDNALAEQLDALRKQDESLLNDVAFTLPELEAMLVDPLQDDAAIDEAGPPENNTTEKGNICTIVDCPKNASNSRDA